MALVPAICTQCGASVEVDNSQEATVCKHCGTAFIVEKAINIMNIQSATFAAEAVSEDNLLERAKYYISIRDFEKGSEYCSRILDQNPHSGKAWKYNLFCEANISSLEECVPSKNYETIEEILDIPRIIQLINYDSYFQTSEYLHEDEYFELSKMSKIAMDEKNKYFQKRKELEDNIRKELKWNPTYLYYCIGIVLFAIAVPVSLLTLFGDIGFPIWGKCSFLLYPLVIFFMTKGRISYKKRLENERILKIMDRQEKDRLLFKLKKM